MARCTCNRRLTVSTWRLSKKHLMKRLRRRRSKDATSKSKDATPKSKRCLQWVLNSRREDLLALPPNKLHTRYVCARHFPPHAFMNEFRNRKTHDATPVPYGVFNPTPTPDLPRLQQDQLVWHDYQRRQDGEYHLSRRRSARLILGAVPCVFEVDPRLHPVKNSARTRRRKKVDEEEKEEKPQILKAYSVEFKAEMWADPSPNASEEDPIGPKRRKISTSKSKETGDTNRDVVWCCALACTNTSSTHLMLPLPRDPALRHAWVTNIDRLDWHPDADSALCETHFSADMWEQWGEEEGRARTLRMDAVPTESLHGEAIKSWVTLDNSGNVSVEDGVPTGQRITAEDEEFYSPESAFEEEFEGSDLFIKSEALEPEIDMVEGSDVSREGSPTEDPFETIYCDTTYDVQDEESSENGKRPRIRVREEFSTINLDSNDGSSDFSEAKNPLDPDSASEDAAHLIQDGEVSCIDDSINKPKKPETAVAKMSKSEEFLFRLQKMKVRRRNSLAFSDEYKCHLCGRRLSRRKNLEIHMQKLHPTGELTPMQKMRKLENDKLLDEMAMKKALKATKPPPALKPLITNCLLTPSTPPIHVSSSFPSTFIPLVSTSPLAGLQTLATIPTLTAITNPDGTRTLTAVPGLTGNTVISTNMLGASIPSISQVQPNAPPKSKLVPSFVSTTLSGTLNSGSTLPNITQSDDQNSIEFLSGGPESIFEEASTITSEDLPKEINKPSTAAVTPISVTTVAVPTSTNASSLSPILKTSSLLSRPNKMLSVGLTPGHLFGQSDTQIAETVTNSSSSKIKSYKGKTYKPASTKAVTDSSDPSSTTGAGSKKQFFLLLPEQKLKSPIQAVSSPMDESQMFTLNLSKVPSENRVFLKKKLRELVDAVIMKSLDPDKIIIAYDRSGNE